MQIQSGDWRSAFFSAIREDSPGSSFITDAEWTKLIPLSNDFVRSLIRRWNNSVADWIPNSDFQNPNSDFQSPNSVSNSNLSSSVKICDANDKTNFQDFVAFKNINDRWTERLRSTNAKNLFQRADQLVLEAKTIVDGVKKI